MRSFTNFYAHFRTQWICCVLSLRRNASLWLITCICPILSSWHWMLEKNSSSPWNASLVLLSATGRKKTMQKWKCNWKSFYLFTVIQCLVRVWNMKPSRFPQPHQKWELLHHHTPAFWDWFWGTQSDLWTWRWTLFFKAFCYSCEDGWVLSHLSFC